MMLFSVALTTHADTSVFCALQIVFYRTNTEEFLPVIEEFSSHIENGEEKETSPYRRNGSKDSGVPGIKIQTQGVSKVRPGL